MYHKVPTLKWRRTSPHKLGSLWLPNFGTLGVAGRRYCRTLLRPRSSKNATADDWEFHNKLLVGAGDTAVLTSPGSSDCEQQSGDQGKTCCAQNLLGRLLDSRLQLTISPTEGHGRQKRISTAAYLNFAFLLLYSSRRSTGAIALLGAVGTIPRHLARTFALAAVSATW